MSWFESLTLRLFGRRPVQGDVRFIDVEFAYETGGKALRDISLHAECGELVALVGPTGCGKTTLVNLIFALYTTPRQKLRFLRVLTKDRPENLDFCLRAHGSPARSIGSAQRQIIRTLEFERTTLLNARRYFMFT